MESSLLLPDGLRVSRLCMGAMTFGGQTEEAEAGRMVDFCFDQGITFFDTANVYTQGRSEEILGRCLGERRKNVILASKARGKMPDYAGLSLPSMRRALEDSLSRLGTDYLDVYYLHQPDYDVPLDESLEALETFRQEGKIRYGAFSNYSGWQACEMQWSSEKLALQPPRISQQMYNLLARGLEQEYLAFARRFGVSLVVYNPLAGGLLTGKHSSAAAPEPGGRFDANQQYQKRYWRPEAFEAVEALRGIAERAGLSLIELSLRWLTQQQSVGSVILGASKFEHLESNVKAAFGPSLDEATRAACDEVWLRLRGVTPIYNR